MCMLKDLMIQTSQFNFWSKVVCLIWMNNTFWHSCALSAAFLPAVTEFWDLFYIVSLCVCGGFEYFVECSFLSMW